MQQLQTVLQFHVISSWTDEVQISGGETFDVWDVQGRL